MHIISLLQPQSGRFDEISLALCKFAIIANQLSPIGDICFHPPSFLLQASPLILALEAICGINSVKCNLHSVLENIFSFVLLWLLIELFIMVILGNTKHPLVPHLLQLEKCTQKNPELELLLAFEHLLEA